ncbi:cation-transporting P-type ATPase [Candidatus Gracilibacteria bacterium]|nr:cation-transporting P-type ATPase [Candidatus Gracilibacteria bacterium]
MSYTGITKAEAEKKLKEFGFNELKAKKKNPWWKIILGQFSDTLVIILIIAAAITLFYGETADAIVILVIIALNAGIGFFQEFKTEKTLEALQGMVNPEARVIRDGKEQSIPIKNIVPDDIIILAEGDKVPADGVLLEVHSLQISEAALTGESVPVKKKQEDKVAMGTAVVKGSGVMKVTATGDKTEIGNIAKLAIETENVLSPLQKELKNIGVFVAKITIIICIIIFVILYFRDGELLKGLMYSVSVAISAVPEGLPTTITIALALGATVLSKKNVIVKKLPSVETLGAVTTICSDKTGTLTRNEMTVREINTSDGNEIKIVGEGYDPKNGEITGDLTAQTTKIIAEISYKCNDAKLVKTENGYSLLGDPTEGALLTMAEKVTSGILDSGKNIENVFPFDSDRKMMSVISNGKVLVKGSPDSILEHSSKIFINGEIVDITEENKKKIQEKYTQMAKKALRVLAFAYREIDSSEKILEDSDAEKNLIFVGLTGMIDPPRDEVKAAVESAKGAGIRTIVITGDFGLTAGAIAEELGMIGPDDINNIFTGEEIQAMSDEKLSDILKERKSLIFARTMPSDKMRIVSLLQNLGEVVAMTGDGVNDAPALKKADIGIAMGITGTEVSKESATMILLNDSFASIVTAIKEGRRIYANMRKFIWYMFSSNIGELVTIVSSIILFIPNVLSAILILCINLGTDILPAISIGADPADDDLMNKKPRDPNSRILNRKFVTSFVIAGAILGLCVIAIFIITLYGDGWHFALGANKEYYHAMTAAFAGLVTIQMINTFSAISPNKSVFKTNYFKNPFHLFAVTTSFVFILILIYVPFFQEYVKTEPLTLKDWGIILIFSFIPMVYQEIKKALGKSMH